MLELLNLLNLLRPEYVVCGPWIDGILQSGLIFYNYSRAMSVDALARHLADAVVVRVTTVPTSFHSPGRLERSGGRFGGWWFWC